MKSPTTFKTITVLFAVVFLLIASTVQAHQTTPDPEQPHGVGDRAEDARSSNLKVHNHNGPLPNFVWGEAAVSDFVYYHPHVIVLHHVVIGNGSGTTDTGDIFVRFNTGYYLAVGLRNAFPRSESRIAFPFPGNEEEAARSRLIPYYSEEGIADSTLASYSDSDYHHSINVSAAGFEKNDRCQASAYTRLNASVEGRGQKNDSWFASSSIEFTVIKD